MEAGCFAFFRGPLEVMAGHQAIANDETGWCRPSLNVFVVGRRLASFTGFDRRVGCIGQWYVLKLPEGLAMVNILGLLPIDVLLLEAGKRIGDVKASATGRAEGTLRSIQPVV